MPHIGTKGASLHWGAPFLSFSIRRMPINAQLCPVNGHLASAMHLPRQNTMSDSNVNAVEQIRIRLRKLHFHGLLHSRGIYHYIPASAEYAAALTLNVRHRGKRSTKIQHDPLPRLAVSPRLHMHHRLFPSSPFFAPRNGLRPPRAPVPSGRNARSRPKRALHYALQGPRKAP